MENNIIEKAIMIIRDGYNPLTEDYTYLDLVLYNNTWYVAKQRTIIVPVGTLPTDTVYWSVYSMSANIDLKITKDSPNAAQSGATYSEFNTKTSLRNIVKNNNLALSISNVEIQDIDFYVTTLNALTSLVGSKYSEYYDTFEGDIFYYSGRYGNAAAAAIYLDKDDNIVGVIENIGALIIVQEIELITPALAVRCRFSSLNTTLDVFKKDDFITSQILDTKNTDLKLNKQTPLIVETGKFINTSNTTTAYPTASYSEYYDTIENDEWLYTGNYGNLATAAMFVDDDFNIISYVENAGGLIDVLDLKIVTPALATKVRFSSLVSTFLIALNSELRDEVNALNNIYGKVFNALGNSLVNGHTLGFDKTWAYKLGQRNKMTVVNYGINGTTITPNGDGNSMLERYAAMGVADYVCVMGGTNDYNQSITIGLETDSFANGGAEETFFGALNDLTEGLITKYPSNKLYFITPFYKGAGIDDYINAIETACGKVGIPVYNNKKDGGVYFQNVAQAAALTMGDGTHLNEAGNEYVSYKYENFMRQL